MKVSLEKGDTVEIAIVEGDRIVGSLSLTLGGAPAAAARRPGRPAGSTNAAPTAGAPKKRERRGGRRVISPEARQRMADAQKKRWAKYRQQKAAK